jgi:hypothetical protein
MKSAVRGRLLTCFFDVISLTIWWLLLFIGTDGCWRGFGETTVANRPFTGKRRPLGAVLVCGDCCWLLAAVTSNVGRISVGGKLIEGFFAFILGVVIIAGRGGFIGAGGVAIGKARRTPVLGIFNVLPNCGWVWELSAARFVSSRLIKFGVLVVGELICPFSRAILGLALVEILFLAKNILSKFCKKIDKLIGCYWNI